jgi:transcriptional regulator with XRE-family HTH domain
MSFDTFSDRLKSARTATGLSQGELAARAGIYGRGASYVSQIEHAAVERLVAVLAEVLRERADAGDTVALAAWQQLPNVKSRSELKAELAVHPTHARKAT